MRRLLMIAVLLASVAAGMLLSRFLLLPEAPATSAAVAPDVHGATSDSAVRGDFSLPNLNGEMRTLANWDNKLRLINFWATWCAPCRREIPLLKAIQSSHGGKGVQVIGIAVDDREPVSDYAAEMEFNYPVLVGQEDAIAAGESFGIDFLGLPFTLIVSADGELLNVHVGELKRDQADAMLKILERLLDDEIDTTAARQALADI